MSAQTGENTWHRLPVFDDGWVELPGLARALSDTRAMNRKKLRGFFLAFGMLALMWVYANLVLSLDDPPAILTYGGLVLGLVLVGAIFYIAVWDVRSCWRNLDQVNRFASWLDGETHVPASDIVDIAATREGDLHVVMVRRSDGRTRLDRSPDAELTDLLGGLRPGVRPQ